MNEEALQEALSSELFSSADRALVRIAETEYQESNQWIQFALALTSACVRNGHAYLDLETPQLVERAQLPRWIKWPSPGDWSEWLSQSPIQNANGAATLVKFVSPSYLYLNRYYDHEDSLAKSIIEKASKDSAIETSLDLFSDDQQKAVAGALGQKYFVITGGPGTGKTTTVVSYLAKALENWFNEIPCRFLAIAPTGKAAARLRESIQGNLDRLDLSTAIHEQIRATPCLTIHRLLGSLPHTSEFRRNKKNPIDCDILVVDEASMIDLPTMRRLMEAVPEHSSIVLLGDKDQLSSVEVGSVFSDLLAASAKPSSPIFSNVATLQKTYRFSEDSSIYQLSQAAREGDADAFLDHLQQESSDLKLHSLSPDQARLPSSLVNRCLSQHEQILESDTPQEALQRLSDFTALTATRKGPLGTAALNRVISERIRKDQKLEADEAYQGMPILIRENNYDLELFNGDIGILWTDTNSSGELFAWFATPSGELKRFRSHWLPSYDLAYAMTIHKSQGSEFHTVACLFDPQDNSFLTRELIYTCLTRAKSQLEIYANPQLLSQAIKTQVHRATRLSELLNGGD